MKFNQFLKDDTAVSPVIGVILMVAITVILAAVIGTFVLGLGDQVSESSPQASFTFDYTDDGDSAATSTSVDSLVVTHDGGDSIGQAQLYAVISGASASDTTDKSAEVNDKHQYSSGFGVSNPVTAGTSITVDSASSFWASGTDISDDSGDSLDLSGATVRIVWESQNSDNTATLAKWEGPDA